MELVPERALAALVAPAGLQQRQAVRVVAAEAAVALSWRNLPVR